MISGKLHRRRDRVKEFPKKLFGGLGAPKDSCVTLIEAYAGPQLPLDEEARNLDNLMRKKNTNETDIGPEIDMTATTPFSTQKAQSTAQTVKPTTMTRLDYAEHEQPNSQAQRSFSVTFEEKRIPNPLEEELCPLESLAEAGSYFLGPLTRSDRDPLGEYECEAEGLNLSSITLMESSQSATNDPENSLILPPEEPVNGESPAGAMALRTRLDTENGPVPLIWNSPNWILGLGLLFLSVLYAHLIYEMREISRGLR